MPGVDTHEARLGTGGPSGGPDQAAQRRATDIDTQITALEGMTTADLRVEWQKLYRGVPPTRMSRDLLLRGIAYKIQERAFGGVSLRTRRKLRSLLGAADRCGTAAASAATLRPGTKLVREWCGRVHTVDVIEDGFEYQGERYRSLSRIARRITGVHWSGPLFFGISKRAPR
jgi:hypothetical protein